MDPECPVARQRSERRVLRQICELEGHFGGVTSVAFSPDNKRVVSGSDDGLVKIREAETGATVSSFVGVR